MKVYWNMVIWNFCFIDMREEWGLNLEMTSRDEINSFNTPLIFELIWRAKEMLRDCKWKRKPLWVGKRETRGLFSLTPDYTESKQNILQNMNQLQDFKDFERNERNDMKSWKVTWRMVARDEFDREEKFRPEVFIRDNESRVLFEKQKFQAEFSEPENK